MDDIPDTDDKESDFPKEKRRVKEELMTLHVTSLKSKHGSLYTPMQFRIWAEMIVGEVHTSHDVPPSNNVHPCWV